MSSSSTLDQQELTRLRLELAAGIPSRNATQPRLRRVLDLSHEIGAPALPGVTAATAALKDVAELENSIRVMSAQAKGVLIIMLLAPYLGLLAVDRFTDVDALAFYRSGIGVVIIVVSVLLQTIAVFWTRRIVAKARSRSRKGMSRMMALVVLCAGTVLSGALAGAAAAIICLVVVGVHEDEEEPFDDEIVELTASALQGGLGHGAALRHVARQRPDEATRLRKLALELDFSRITSNQPLATALALARQTGAPVVEILRDLAQSLRAQELARALAASQKLPTQLLYPIASCLMPPTLVIATTPLVLDVFTSMQLA